MTDGECSLSLVLYELVYVYANEKPRKREKCYFMSTLEISELLGLPVISNLFLIPRIFFMLHHLFHALPAMVTEEESPPERLRLLDAEVNDKPFEFHNVFHREEPGGGKILRNNGRRIDSACFRRY